MTTVVATLGELHQRLGIPEDYGRDPARPRYEQALELQTVVEGPRSIQLTSATARAWVRMRRAALQDGVEVQLVSGYRSIAYQCGLIERQLTAGRTLADILACVAAPGFSQHHTGRAIDVSTPGCEPLSEAFEHTDAFAWLGERAGALEFTLSYPRDNPFGFVYEPWHWGFQFQV